MSSFSGFSSICTVSISVRRIEVSPGAKVQVADMAFLRDVMLTNFHS